MKRYIIILLCCGLLLGNTELLSLQHVRQPEPPLRQALTNHSLPLFPIGLVRLPQPQQENADPDSWMQASIQILKQQQGCGISKQQPRLNAFAETYFDRVGIDGTRWEKSNRQLILSFISQDSNILKEAAEYFRNRPGEEGYIFTLSLASFASRFPDQGRNWIKSIINDFNKYGVDLRRKTYPDEFVICILNYNSPCNRLPYIRNSYSFNMLVLRIMRNINEMRKNYSREKCIKKFNSIMVDMSNIMRINACPKMVAYFENFLYRKFYSNDDFLYNVMRIYTSIMSNNFGLSERLFKKIESYNNDISCKSYIYRNMGEFINMAKKNKSRINN